MNPNSIIKRLKSFFELIRHGQWEQALAISTLALFAFAGYIQKVIPSLPQVAYSAYTVGAICAVWLAARLWRQAVPPPPTLLTSPSSAIKGLLPFTAADGKIFARLGRRTELQTLMALTRDDQIGVAVVRGQSGAGKTSLLQAGLAYALGKKGCIYWEAVPTNAAAALLRAIRLRLPDVSSLESLPGEYPNRCVLILDQFEQLHQTDPEHAAIFSLLGRIAAAPAPHRVTAVVGYRREYAADWLDFEQSSGLRAEQMPLNLLAPPTARDALIVLAGEAGLTLDHSLVGNFIDEVAQPDGVLPVDISIGVLSLSNYALQSGNSRIGMAEYELAGGAEGLLMTFVQQKLDEIPEAMRSPLLKGMVFALVDLSNNQRVAEGATAAVIATKAETSEDLLLPWLERFSHPRIRLLEKPRPDSYRLPHDRLVPVIRRLTGKVLASLDQLRLTFENQFGIWRRARSRLNLIGGRELKEVLRNRDQFVVGDSALLKAEYLRLCIGKRNFERMGFLAIAIALVISGFFVLRSWNSSIQHSKLRSWGLREEIYEDEEKIDELDIDGTRVNDLLWLRSSQKMRTLKVLFAGSSLSGVEHLKALTTLSLDLTNSAVTDLEPLGQLDGLTTLVLRMPMGVNPDLAPIGKLKRLTSLSLAYTSQVRPFNSINKVSPPLLASLGQLKSLTSLTLGFDYGFAPVDISWIKDLHSLTSVSLDLPRGQSVDATLFDPLKSIESLELRGSPLLTSDLCEHLGGLTKLTLFATLSLNTRNIETQSELSALKHCRGLTTLAVRLSGPGITPSQSFFTQLARYYSISLSLGIGDKDLKALEPLNRARSLSLHLWSANVNELAGLEDFTELKSLSFERSDDPFSTMPQDVGLATLAQLKRLTTLSLSLPHLGQPPTLDPIEKLLDLTSVTLSLHAVSAANFDSLKQLGKLSSLKLSIASSAGQDLTALGQFTKLTSLDLNLSESKATKFPPLGALKELTAATITIPSSMIPAFNRSGIRNDLTKLRIVMDRDSALRLPDGCNFVALADH